MIPPLHGPLYPEHAISKYGTALGAGTSVALDFGTEARRIVLGYTRRDWRWVLIGLNEIDDGADKGYARVSSVIAEAYQLPIDTVIRYQALPLACALPRGWNGGLHATLGNATASAFGTYGLTLYLRQVPPELLP